MMSTVLPPDEVDDLPSFESALDSLWAAGATGLTWSTEAWSVLLTDEDVQAVRSDLSEDVGLETDGIRRMFGDDSQMLRAVAAAEANLHLHEPELVVHFGSDTLVLATPDGFEVFTLDEDN